MAVGVGLDLGPNEGSRFVGGEESLETVEFGSCIVSNTISKDVRRRGRHVTEGGRRVERKTNLTIEEASVSSFPSS